MAPLAGPRVIRSAGTAGYPDPDRHQGPQTGYRQAPLGRFCDHAGCPGGSARDHLSSGPNSGGHCGSQAPAFCGSVRHGHLCDLSLVCRRPGSPQPDNRRRSLRLTFNQADVEKSQRRRRSCAEHHPGSNLRAAVEATVRSVKHPFPAGKLPVRGQFRVTCLVIASALMTNVRRIQRYLMSTRPKPSPRQQKRQELRHRLGPALATHFSTALRARLSDALMTMTTYKPRFSLLQCPLFSGESTRESG